MIAVESILDGTWASGAPPEEWIDYQLMKHMGWSWNDLQSTPLYVRRYCWDIACAQAAQEQAEIERAERRSGR